MMPLAWADLEDGLIAHYKFDGYLEDSSGYNHYGSGNFIPTNGKFGKPEHAIRFDHTQNVISVSDSNEFRDFSGFTVSAWMSSYDGGILIQQGGLCPQEGRSFEFGIIERQLKLSVYNEDQIAEIVSGESTLLNGNWHHIAAVFDQGQMALYIDGKEASKTYDAPFTVMGNSSDRVSIGHLYSYCDDTEEGYADKQYAFEGTVDELRVYRRALSDNEIQEICCKPVAVFKCQQRYDEMTQRWLAQCDAKASYDQDGGQIQRYFWEVSDGQAATGPQKTFYFDDSPAVSTSCSQSSQTHQISLTVVDDENQNSEKAKQQFNTPVGPAVQFTCQPASGEALPGEQVKCDGRQSADPCGNGIKRYEWKTSDGQTDSSAYTSFTFNSPCDYDISLTVTNDTGQKGHQDKKYSVSKPTAQLDNISTRAYVGKGDNSTIAGFIIGGTGMVNTIIKCEALPSIDPLGIQLDPYMALKAIDRHSNYWVNIANNDNWLTGSNTSQILPYLGQSPPPTLAALGTSLNAGVYTVVVNPSPNNDSTALGIVSVNDIGKLFPGDTAKFINISTRALVSDGVKNVVAGFIIGGTGKLKVVVKAIGQGLRPGINTDLDPMIELWRISAPRQKIATNDDWEDDGQASQIPVHLRPQHRLDAALFRELAAGAYTVEVRPKNSSAGVGLVGVDVLEEQYASCH
jgi:hypothetical protein